VTRVLLLTFGEALTSMTARLAASQQASRRTARVTLEVVP
jgi:hypothetical protein